MKMFIILCILTLPLISGCGDHFRTLWHDARLPSGKTVRVTAFYPA